MTSVDLGDLGKAYLDVGSVIKKTNGDISSFNTRTIFKTYMIYLGLFALGYLSVMSAMALFGKIGAVAVSPLIYMGWNAMQNYTEDIFVKDILKFVEKIQKESKLDECMKKYSKKILEALNIHFARSWMPHCCSKIEMNSFPEAEKVYKSV